MKIVKTSTVCGRCFVLLRKEYKMNTNNQLREFCEEIGLREEAIEMMLGLPITEVRYKQVREAFYSQEGEKSEFYKLVNQQKQWMEQFLYYYCRFAQEAKERYRRQGISEEIYRDTFKDITLWCEKCYDRFQRYGIYQYDWLWRHVEGKLYRLGRLQFEQMNSEWEVKEKEWEIAVGDDIISVHIPEGEPLSEAACVASFVRAKAFFQGEQPYLCHSWLLDPALKAVIKEKSNILKFQKFFYVVRVDYENKEAEERIFGSVCRCMKKYRAETRLQKSAKQFLLAGNKLGNGLGIFKGMDN